MSAIQIGRVITKLAGREAGEKAVIIAIIDQNFVLITGAGISSVKRRRSNIKHIDVMDILIAIGKDADDAQVKVAINKNQNAKQLFKSTAK